MTKITKGVIIIAGFGTRFLPASKTTPKEMLPIINKPIIQYVVEEMVQAGITDIILVTSWQKRSVEDHFDRSREVEEHLEDNHKLKLLKEIRKIDQLANFIYVRQKGGRGNGAALLSVENIINNEPFILAFGDDLVKSKTSFCTQMIEEYQKYRCPVIGVQEVVRSDIEKYGMVELKDNSNYVKSIVEKPQLHQTESNLAVFGRYLLIPEIFSILKKTPTGKDGELWLADALEYMLQTHNIAACKVKDGQWYTTGDPLNYFKTLLAYSIDQPEFKKELKKFSKKL